MKTLILILLAVVPCILLGQRQIHIKKKLNLEGVYCQVTENKNKQYLYFDTLNVVYLYTSRFRKRKAVGRLLACSELNNCFGVESYKYEMNENSVTFFFQRQDYIKKWFCELTDDRKILMLKFTESGQIQKVSKFMKLK